jgi:hypothetical protein
MTMFDRLRDQESRTHTFTLDLTPSGQDSCVLLDGEDISSFLQGIVVRASVHHATIVELFPGKGQRAQLTVRVPEAQIVIVAPEEQP